MGTPYTPLNFIDYVPNPSLDAANLNYIQNGIVNATNIANAAIPESAVTTKGDLLVGSGNGAVTRLPAGTDGYVPIADSTQALGVRYGQIKPLTGQNPLTGWFHVNGYGAKGDGTTDDTAAIQNALNDWAASGGTLYFPDGIYSVNGTLSATVNDGTIKFAGDAWLQPTTGTALTLTGQRITLNSPRVRINGGTPTTGILFTQATRVSVLDPIVWAFANITGTLDGIVVDNNSYWVTIERPRFRMDSGTLTGSFRRCVAFTNTSNAGRVIGGDFGNATTGVYIDSSNAVTVDGGAFEGVTDGIELGGVNSVAGARICNTRHESGTNCVNITTTYATLNSPIFIGPVSHISSVTNLITNPNNIAYQLVNGSQWSLTGNGYGESAAVTISLNPYSSQTGNCLEVLSSTGTVRNFAVDRNGNVFVASPSATWPTTSDTVGVLRYYNNKTTLATVQPSGVGGSVSLGVGNGSGGEQDVLVVSAYNVGPGADNTQALGSSTKRFTYGFFASYVKIGAMATTSRPSASTAGAGASLFDTTLGKPIWSNGTSWVDATGTAV